MEWGRPGWLGARGGKGLVVVFRDLVVDIIRTI